MTDLVERLRARQAEIWRLQNEVKLLQAAVEAGLGQLGIISHFSSMARRAILRAINNALEGESERRDHETTIEHADHMMRGEP